MEKTAPIRVKIWPGLMSAADPHDLAPGGAQVQENLTCLSTGMLEVRKGIQKSSGFTPSSPSAYDLISLFNLQRPDADFLVTFNTNGAIEGKRSSTAFSIATGKSTERPYCFTKTRKGYMVCVNGIDRGVIWRGMDSAAIPLGVDPPASAPTVTTPGSGGATAGDYTIGVRFRDDDGNYSNFCDFQTVTAADSDKFEYSDIPQSAQDRVTHMEIWRSLADTPEVLYYIGEVSDGTTTFTTDTSTDNDLIAAAVADATKVLPITNPDGTPYANRYTPPPDTKSVAVPLQNRMLYAVDHRYTKGTAATTNASATITGTGTAWTSEMVGRYFYMDGLSVPLVIESVDSATQLTATENADATLSAGAYAIMPDPADADAIFFSEEDLEEAVPAVNRVTLQQQWRDSDRMTGVISFGSVAYVTRERHIYTLTFVRQPQVDADSRLLAQRGCLNQNTFDFHEGMAYVMDQAGIYRLTVSGSITPLSGPIQDKFSEGVIDFSKSEWFHACADYEEEIVRFFVAFVGDSGTRPKNALCFNIRENQWWVEPYIDEIGGSCRANSSGRLRAMCAGEDDVIFTMSEGTTDVVTSEVRGTATSSGNDTLTDSGATFATSVVGAPIAIISGTGKGQIRKIIARPSGTQVQVDSNWTTNPSTDSVYLIGAIAWVYKTGMLTFAPVEKDIQRMIGIVFTPTTDENTFDVRRYINHEASPENYPLGYQISPSLLTREQGDPNLVVNMKLQRSARAKSAGYAEVLFSGVTPERFEGERFVTLELRGYQGDDRIVINDLVFQGMLLGID